MRWFDSSKALGERAGYSTPMRGFVKPYMLILLVTCQPRREAREGTKLTNVVFPDPQDPLTSFERAL
jgi:hypothetical protein